MTHWDSNSLLLPNMTRLIALILVLFTVIDASLAFITQKSSGKQQWSPPQSFLRMATPDTTTKGAFVAPPLPTVNDPDQLIPLAHEYVYEKSGFYSPPDEDIYSVEFVFRGPYIGPLNKADYLSTMNTFRIYEALPDIDPNAFGYSIDPKNPRRVWFIVRNTGTFTGSLDLGITKINGEGQRLDGAPETFSITFDEDRRIKYLTVGYVADRFEGNTGGTGAAVGIFNAAGIPFPSPGLGLKMAQWIGTEVVTSFGAKSYSVDNIPAWWTSSEKGGEGYK